MAGKGHAYHLGTVAYADINHSRRNEVSRDPLSIAVDEAVIVLTVIEFK